jgi:maltose alpha-D-glucosyltransferase / alpha-amylase
MDNDRRKIELMNSLLLSFPGTPIIYYGDEIGMGDNIYLGDRNGVRTPMQWAPDRNGGFSRADPAKLYAPMIMDPVYGYEAVNVEAQSRSHSSLLNATKRLISVRKSTLAFGRGTMSFIRPANRAVLAYVRQYNDEVILCVANLSRSAQATELDLSAWKDRIPVEMLGRSRFPAIGDLPYMITLAPYGFYWFQLQERGKSEPVAPRELPEFETLVVPLGSTWVSLARTRGVFEHDVLPGHLARTRWYPEHTPDKIRPALVSAIPFCDIGDNRPWLIFFEATLDGRTSRYHLPMQIEWVRFDRERYNPIAFAAVRQGAREGTVLDVATEPIFLGLLLRNLKESLTVEENGLRLEFRPTGKFLDRTVREPERIRPVETDWANNSSLVDNDYVVKVYRRMEAGLNPAIEIGRFMTDAVCFANAPVLLGSVEFVEDGKRYAIATVHALVENQGDGWTVSSAYLDRYIDDHRLLAARENGGESEQQSPYLRYMSQAGWRAAELHLALASRPDLTDFAPEPTRPEHVRGWISQVEDQAKQVFDALSQKRERIPESDRALVDRILAQRESFADRLAELLPPDIDGQNIRLHGDLRLGQMLIVKDDIFIGGFDGDPSVPLDERRRKAPPARDVACLINSIDYSVGAALERVLGMAPDEQGRLKAAVIEWRNRAMAAFLTGYRETMRDSQLWPADPHAADALINFFLLERVLYDIEDELAHRPDWLRIPLTGLLRILSDPASETL